MSDSTPATLCSHCGSSLPDGVSESQCPKCLMAEAMRPTAGSKPTGPWVPPTAEELHKLLPQYEITALLGRGGMGAVYKGRQIALDRPVAIKILSNALDEADASFAERFKNEARALGKLSHPGIVGVHDFGEAANALLYIVMEFIDGTDVARMLTQHKRLHTEHAMAITAHVCDALAYAHERGIIHRDIKPANIMVGYDGVVKVADFGLAKMTHNQNSGLTQSGMAMGTLHYMAPEALMLGSAVDHRADIYAVGVMLYQMLTGKLPQGMFELPSLQVKGLDPRYDGIIAKALREDREMRYQNIREMRGDLDGILTQPVVKLEAAKESPPPAALPTQARPQRPGGVRQPYHPSQPAQPPAAKSSNGWLVWAVLGVLALGAGYWWMNQPSDLGRGRQTVVETTFDGVLENAATSTSAPQAAPSAPATSTPPSITPLASSSAPELAKTAPARKTWPTGPNFRVEGRFRAWSSQPNDPALDLAKLQGVDDVSQVYVNSGGWLVLRQNGDLLSHISGFPGQKNIRRICRGNADDFALITRAGGVIPFPPRTDSTNRIPDGLGPVKDVYVSSFRQVAILEDGSLVAWGTAHDGIVTRGNGEWKDKPVLPPGRKAVAMSNTTAAMGLRTDDGKILRWGGNGGFIQSLDKFDADPETPFLLNGMALYAIPKTNGPILVASWRGHDPATPFASDIRGRDFITANKGEKNTLLLDRNGKIVLDPMCEDRSITAALDHVSQAERDLVSVHFEEKNSPVTRFLWFDKAGPALTASLPASDLQQLPDFRTRVANYQKARHAQLSALIAKYRSALTTEKDAAAQSGVLASVSAADAALAGITAFTQLIETNLTATEVKPLPTIVEAADAAPPRLKELRDIFVSEVTKIESTLITGLDQSLATVHASLVQTDKPAEARAVEAYRKSMLAAFKPTTSSSPLSATLASVTTTHPAEATKDKPFVNSLGMKFVPVPGAKVLMCIHETRHKDYAAFEKANPQGNQEWRVPFTAQIDMDREGEYPVVSVSWLEAVDFGDWLSRTEGFKHRLPTDEEWSAAVGAAEFPWGNEWPPPRLAGNYADESTKGRISGPYGHLAGYNDGFVYTAPVMSFSPNNLGIHDLGGNVWEWCLTPSPARPEKKILRGAAWNRSFRNDLASSMRVDMTPGDHFPVYGFRVVIELPATSSEPKPAPPSVRQPSASPSAATKDRPFVNSLGMKFVPVPGTKVLFCIHETRYRDYAAYATENPNADHAWKEQSIDGIPPSKDPDNNPVNKINYEDVLQFCDWLSQKERKVYRLPSDEEWTAAHGFQGVGSQAANMPEFPWGNVWPPPSGSGNFGDLSRNDQTQSSGELPYMSNYQDGFRHTSPVMSFKPNNLGIYDLSGNVWEWCEEPGGGDGKSPLLRGGSCASSTRGELSLSTRIRDASALRRNGIGVRIVLDLAGTEADE